MNPNNLSTDELIAKLQEMVKLAPDSLAGQFFAAVAERLRALEAEAEEAHQSKGDS